MRESPKGALMGSGVGGSWHIAVGGLLKAAGLGADRVRFVPSTGGAPALQDVVAGGLTMFTGSPIEAKPMLDAGRVRTLVLMTEQRSPTFPTTREQNVDWVYANWFALVAPNGMAQDRRAKLSEAAKRAMAKDDVRQQLLDRGIQPVWDEPGAFAAYLNEFVARGNAVLRDLGLAKT